VAEYLPGESAWRHATAVPCLCIHTLSTQPAATTIHSHDRATHSSMQRRKPHVSTCSPSTGDNFFFMTSSLEIALFSPPPRVFTPLGGTAVKFNRNRAVTCSTVSISPSLIAAQPACCHFVTRPTASRPIPKSLSHVVRMVKFAPPLHRCTELVFSPGQRSVQLKCRIPGTARRCHRDHAAKPPAK